MILKVKNILYNEFISGKTIKDWAFLGVGLCLQFIAIIIGFATDNPESLGLIISGISGVISVVLCSQGKISFYFFGFIQLFTYVFCFSVPNHLHGETIENGMYFITMLIGIYIWAKHYGKDLNSGETEVKARKLSLRGNIIINAIFVIGVLVYYYILKTVPMFGALDSQPFMDSLTSVPAYIGQALMVLGFREQWIYWGILDVGSVILSWRAGSLIMVMQFIFWTVNCVYGYIKWNNANKNDDLILIN